MKPLNHLKNVVVGLSLFTFVSSPLYSERIHPIFRYWKKHSKPIDISAPLVEDPKVMPKEGEDPIGVTYELSGGRLGDNLISFMHAKWISYKYNIPLLYRDFEHADAFAFSQKYDLFTNEIEEVSNIRHIGLKRREKKFISVYPLYYNVLYFPDCRFEHFGEYVFYNHYFPYFHVDWSDPNFRKELLSDLTSSRQFNLIYPPKGYTSVAVHMRRGGGVDCPHSLTHSPLNFPPDAYYTSQLRRVIDHLEGEKVFVHLFTDDQNPKALVEMLRSTLLDCNIEFGFTDPKILRENPVMEDFFSLANFDCLIHAQSNFSVSASKLKKYRVRVCPENYCVKKGKVIITEITFERNDV